MDTRDGLIYTPEQMEKMKKLWAKAEEEMHKNMLDNLKAQRPKPNKESEERFIKEMIIPPTKKQIARRPPRVGRNEPCPCGSGKKFKNCCLGSIK